MPVSFKMVETKQAIYNFANIVIELCLMFSVLFVFMSLVGGVLLSSVSMASVQHYKITPAELEISSLADAITCRIAARDAL